MTSDQRITRLTQGPPPASEQTSPAVKAGTAGPVAADKAALRKQLLAVRRNLPADTRAQWDADICRHIVAWWHETQLDALGVYWPLRDEPDLHPAYAELARLGVRLSLPVVLQRDAPLDFAAWQIGEPLVKDAMGIAVPAELRIGPYPPALLVPCLGFNAAGYRLGYGGGFYDRTLEKEPRPATVGIAYSCLAAEFGSDGHDIALDRIITEAG
ncbi:5-formyltetrahydrofolate cyclo-ligase [Pseudoduganella lutea]|uniref:5-formyltetrahydrofolate cyclo-ligase n=1 Tax=Pseudoduganella lutea TaxID=321985 RepID=A0A4P6KXN4_9BURK|nr:5-formyltetrahydrofolate cyclo-ligase [Pseudoduganella lutea]QBE63495.1 5-formyltetrahydrofolate cyclo-ligase [Pseudoduganella lutea]